MVGGHPKALTHDPLQQKHRPLFGGLQLQVGSSYGTLGFLANTNGGSVVAISNHHVLGVDGTSVGQASSGDKIGITGASVLNHLVDAAYVTLDQGITTSGQIGKRTSQGKDELVSVAGTYTPSLGDLPYPVWKTGRTTATTFGNIDTINGTVTHEGGIRMTGQLYVDGGSVQFMKPGDSGSALIDGSNRIVALMWGHLTSADKKGIGSPIAAVESELDLSGPVIPTSTDIEDMPVTDFQPVIASVLDRFEANPNCAPVAAFVRAHGEEIDRLLGSNDHLTVAWHKNSGHDILMTVMNNVQAGGTPLPAEIWNGQDVVEAMDAFGAALKKRGPAHIAQEAFAIRDALVWMVGKSYDEVFAAPGYN